MGLHYFFRKPPKEVLLAGEKYLCLTVMDQHDDMMSLSRDELLQRLAGLETELQAKNHELQTKQDEIQAYRQQLRSQNIALQTKEVLIAQLITKYLELEQEYNELVQRTFRKRSERYTENPDQLRLDLGDTPEAANAAEGLADAVEELKQTIPEPKRRRRQAKKRNEQLPAHLPRREVVADTPDDVRNCPTHGPRTLLPESMWDVTETLVFQRPKLEVLVTKYPKYACDKQPECGIQSPERPVGIVEGNKYDTSVATVIISGKFGFHLTLYRLQDYFAGSGWIPSRGTQNNILARCLFVLLPLLAYFKQILQQDSVVGCDDTSTTLLYPKVLPPFDLNDPKQRRIHEVFSNALEKKEPSINAKMWVYRGTTVKLNVFDFTVSRHRDGPALFFADYHGTLLGDCWSGFEAIAVASNGAIVRAACNSHARRKILQSQAYPDDRDRWLVWYQQLYDIEDRGKTLSDSDRLTLRQTEAKPIWDAMQEWLEEADQRVTHVILPKSDFGKALQYLRNHWVELRRYLDDPRIPIDNNDTEQLMKQVALGRKNWLFAGSVAGGERNAAFLTLVSSAVRNNLDVELYVKDVLDQLLAGATDYEPLLPWNWAQKHPEAIRQYRIEERRDWAVRQQAQREARRVSSVVHS
jgi:transposase